LSLVGTIKASNPEGIIVETGGDHRLLQSLPAAFDGRTKWPGCIHPILDQGHCDGCWAFGTTSTFTDRICIASNGGINAVMSEQYMLSCDSTD
jgi:C1A family cysteine protease